jgi:hypothetical protein
MLDFLFEMWVVRIQIRILGLDLQMAESDRVCCSSPPLFSRWGSVAWRTGLATAPFTARLGDPAENVVGLYQQPG